MANSIAIPGKAAAAYNIFMRQPLVDVNGPDHHCGQPDAVADNIFNSFGPTNHRSIKTRQNFKKLVKIFFLHWIE